MTYDSQNKVHILCGGRGAKDALLNDLWVYDAQANTWTEMKPNRPGPKIDTMLFSYDEEHNVCVLADYRPTTPMYVYRYQRARK